MEHDKLRAEDGEKYLFKELDRIYLRDKFDQFQRAYFELKRYTIREANKERPKEDNEYEYFVSKFRAKVRKFKDVSTFLIPEKVLVYEVM